jgi:hypothetical protein
MKCKYENYLEKYEKKRDSLSPTLKYLIGSLIVKG